MEKKIDFLILFDFTVHGTNHHTRGWVDYTESHFFCMICLGWFFFLPNSFYTSFCIGEMRLVEDALVRR